RSQMEEHLGADLSHVKVHTGGESENAASSLGARAFTVGSDVHFNSGEFNPGSKEGQKLLAHELTHGVQEQRSGVHHAARAEGAEGEGAGAEAPGAEAPAAEAPAEEGGEQQAAEGGERGDPEEALNAAIAAGEQGDTAEADGETQEVSTPDQPAEKEADQKAE